MVIKHSTAHVPNDIVASADWNANHTGTAEPDAHAIDGAKHTGDITDAQHGIRTLANAHSHANLSNVTSDQHHAQLHNAASHTDIVSTGAQIDDAVSKKHTQNTDTALGAQTQNLDMNTHKIVGVVDPTADQEAATKKYVDDSIPGVGTSYWSCSGLNFTPRFPDVNDVSYSVVSGKVEPSVNGISFGAPVFLPQGAVVTAVAVYGNAAATEEVWILTRAAHSNNAAANMATASIGTEDITIDNATIDNNTYAYFFNCSSLDAGDEIWSARITYTL